MGKTRQNQTPEAEQTDTLAMEDETLNTNKAGQVVPSGIGQMKTTCRWISPIYNMRAVAAQKGSGGKGGK